MTMERRIRISVLLLSPDMYLFAWLYAVYLPLYTGSEALIHFPVISFKFIRKHFEVKSK